MKFWGRPREVRVPVGLMRDVYQVFPIHTLTQAGEQRVAIREGQLDTVQYLRAEVLGHPDYYRHEQARSLILAP